MMDGLLVVCHDRTSTSASLVPNFPVKDVAGGLVSGKLQCTMQLEISHKGKRLRDLPVFACLHRASRGRRLSSEKHCDTLTACEQ